MKTIKLSELNKKREIIWLEDPTKYEYVREGNYTCCSVNYKPIKKGEKIQLDDNTKAKLKLIGYEKPKKISEYEPRLYQGLYYWLKPYDRGMPYAHLCYGKWYVPSEAIKIVKW